MDLNPVSLAVMVISSVLWILIYCPIIIYHLREYQSRRHNVVYSMRYANITVIQYVIFICKLIFGVFAMASSFIIFDRFSIEDKLIHSVNAYLAAFFLYCFVWKFWLLRYVYLTIFIKNITHIRTIRLNNNRYNIMLNNIVMNGEWKSIINKHESATDSFYAKYKKKFGDAKCTAFIWLIMAMILTTFYVISNIFYPDFYTDSEDSNPYLDELFCGWDYM